MSETMIHPETGAILRRRKRTETITYQGQSRTVEVEGWFPDNDGDGILVGADSKPLDDALAEMKCGWPGKPGVPMNPEQDSEGHVWRVDGVMDIHKWVAKRQWYENQKGHWVTPDQLIADGDTYFGRIVTPAEVDARATEARRDALEEAARRLEELHKNHKYKPETGEGSEHDTGYYRAIAEGVAHIRALSDTPPDMEPGQLAKQDLRSADCIKQWPECEPGAYDPRCCRFPKSCSCESGALKGETNE